MVKMKCICALKKFHMEKTFRLYDETVKVNVLNMNLSDRFYL